MTKKTKSLSGKTIKISTDKVSENIRPTTSINERAKIAKELIQLPDGKNLGMKWDMEVLLDYILALINKGKIMELQEIMDDDETDVTSNIDIAERINQLKAQLKEHHG